MATASRSKLASSRPAIVEDDAGSDTLAPLRRCSNRIVDCIVMSKWVSILFAMLPSIYLSCILMYLNTPTGLPATIAAMYSAGNGGSTVSITDPAVVQYTTWLVGPLTNYVGCIAGFTIIFVRVARWCGERAGGSVPSRPRQALSLWEQRCSAPTSLGNPPPLPPPTPAPRVCSLRHQFNSSGRARCPSARGRLKSWGIFSWSYLRFFSLRLKQPSRRCPVSSPGNITCSCQ